MSRTELQTPFTLSAALVLLMALQAALGLAFRELYRDVDWIRTAWYGNDWVTLVVAVPLFVIALTLARRGSMRGVLLWLGMIGYTIYNYAFYMFAAALNAFFLLYVVTLVLAVATLILLLMRIDPPAIANAFRPQTPVRIVGGYFGFVAAGLTAIWLGMWAAYAFAGRPTPSEPEAFKMVAALDLSLMVPALSLGGILLWRRRPWGYVIAPLAGIQGALYLLVLAVNSTISIRRGLAEAPGELPVWGTLAIFTAIAAIVLMANVRAEPAIARKG